MRHLRRHVAVALVTTGLALSTTTGPAAADNGPRQTTYGGALLYSAVDADASPPGANDWTCRPSARHPHPVVLVHGTAENRYTTWSELAPRLTRAGYCVYALNYSDTMATPFHGMGDIVNSAYQLRHFIDRVLRATGAREVDVVGHSQGGMMPRYYLQRLGGGRHVHRLIGLAPSNYGTTFYGVLPLVSGLPGGAAVLSVSCQACAQQTVGSPFLDDLNRGDDTVRGVRYTTIVTKYDEVVVPYTNGFLRDGGARNITLQDICADDHADHLGVPYDPDRDPAGPQRARPSSREAAALSVRSAGG